MNHPDLPFIRTDIDPPVVVDPLSWLEADGPELQTWLADQRERTAAAAEHRPQSMATITAACRSARSNGYRSVPLGRGGRWFFHCRQPGEERVALHVASTMVGTGRPLIDPQSFDDARGLASFGADYPSPDGRHLIASVFRGGRSDTELVLVAVPEDGPAAILDRIDTRSAAFAVWHDTTSYFCSREVDGRAVLTLRQLDGRESELAPPCDTTGARLVPITSDDLAWLFVSVHAPGWDGPRTFVAANTAAPVFHEFDAFDRAKLRMAWWGPRGPILITRPKGGSPREVVEVDLTDLPGGGSPRTRILHRDETDSLVTGLAAPSGDVLLVLRGPGGADRYRHLAPDGSVEDIAFEDGVSIKRTTIERSTGAMLASMQSWRSSHRLVQYDFATRAFTVLREAHTALDITVATETVAAADGTALTVTLLRPPHASTNPPCLMVAYGAFGGSLTPWCLSVFEPWFAAGGVVAQAHVRGGGERGRGWHEAARGPVAKMVSFTDLIALCRGLAAKGIIQPERLCLYGIGAGGLLVLGAGVMAPDLCAAIIADGPLADMAKFHRFGTGAYWVREFGDPATDLAAIARWSPLHRLVPGTPYPPTLVIVGADDDRETPVHGRKMVAALQAAGSAGPYLLDEVPGVGNADAVTLTGQSEGWANVQSFAAWATGLPLG